MLVFGWLLLGLAGLFAASAVLTQGQKPGTYVSPYGALQFLLTGNVVVSQWPWGQVSLSGVLANAAEAAGGGLLSGITGGLLGGGGSGGAASASAAPDACCEHYYGEHERISLDPVVAGRFAAKLGKSEQAVGRFSPGPCRHRRCGVGWQQSRRDELGGLWRILWAQPNRTVPGGSGWSLLRVSGKLRSTGAGRCERFRRIPRSGRRRPG